MFILYVYVVPICTMRECEWLNVHDITNVAFVQNLCEIYMILYVKKHTRYTDRVKAHTLYVYEFLTPLSYIDGDVCVCVK